MELWEHPAEPAGTAPTIPRAEPSSRQSLRTLIYLMRKNYVETRKTNNSKRC